MLSQHHQSQQAKDHKGVNALVVLPDCAVQILYALPGVATHIHRLRDCLRECIGLGVEVFAYVTDALTYLLLVISKLQTLSYLLI